MPSPVAMPHSGGLIIDPNAFSGAVFAIDKGSYGIANVLIPNGDLLLTALMGVMIAYRGIKWVLGDEDLEGMIRDFIDLILLWGIAAFILLSYTTVLHHFGNGFNYFGVEVLRGQDGGSGSLQSYSQAVNSAVALFGHVIEKIFDLAIYSHLKGHWYDIGRLANEVLFLVLDLIVGFSIFAVLLIYVLSFGMSIIMFSIGVAIGPILIPFLVWDYSSFLFDGWLRYMFIAGMMRVVGAVMVALTVNMLPTVQQYALAMTKEMGPGKFPIASIVITILLAGLMAGMMSDIPLIAAAIVSGTSRMGKHAGTHSVQRGLGKGVMKGFGRFASRGSETPSA